MAAVGLAYVGAICFLSGTMRAAFLLLTGHHDVIGASTFATILAVFAVVVFGALFVRMRQPGATPRGITVPRPA